MATIGKLSRKILPVYSNYNLHQANLRTWKCYIPKTKTIVKSAVGTTVAMALGGTFVLCDGLLAWDFFCEPGELPFTQKGWFSTLDHRSVRRGYYVYKNVCAACHSLEFICYRHMVNVIFTQDEAKAEAAEIMVEDGPDDLGNMYKRPGKLGDHLPAPYRNEEEAKAANNKLLPPDLSLIVRGRAGNEDYIFHILTGYYDPPAGIEMDEGTYYNPFFRGYTIGMAQALFDETVEYDDGTIPYQSQLAKDVVNFLSWTAEIHQDERKKIAIMGFFILIPLNLMFYWYKRKIFTVLKNRKLIFLPQKRRLY